MAAEVETMFSVRERPWHGLGTIVEEAPDSETALKLAGLDWMVEQRQLYTEFGKNVPGYKVNIRDKDEEILGIVTDRYKVVQNTEAFAFTDELLGKGVQYETAGSLQNGKKTWILAKLPEPYVVTGEEVNSYLVFSNSHDGLGAIRVAITPIRVVCQNTLNLALNTASRSWASKHMGNIQEKIEEAEETLFLADKYMKEFGKEAEKLQKIKMPDKKVEEYIELLLPIRDDITLRKKKNIHYLREELKMRYFEAPDLQHMGKNAFRFINAVSDFSTHSTPLRTTHQYREQIFDKTIKGNPLIDKAYEMVKEIA